MKVWTAEEEGKRLAERFVGVNQAAFARDYKVPGGASMVSQHIKGRRPMNLAAAMAYAKGFGVPLDEISPRNAVEVANARELQKISETSSPAEGPGCGDDVKNAPTIGATIIQLGLMLGTLNAMGRASIAPLIAKVMDNPELAPDAAAMADAIARSQRLGVGDESVNRAFSRAQESPVETGLSPLESKS